MAIQMALGADVAMAFDQCPPWPAPEGEVAAACRRTHAWLERCISAHERPDQALFGIVQGGCFPALRAFLAPLMVFGRNIPVAALIPLTFFFFGIGEFQKVMFLFIASVAFVLSDTTAAVLDVPQRYVDTALTLGASRWQIITKVLGPLAAPSIFNSLRLLFGLAFGYVMLAELVKFGSATGGLGDLINMSQRRGEREPIILVLVIIPMVAWAIDRASARTRPM